MSAAVEVLQSAGLSDSPAKPKDSADVPLEEAHESTTVETEDPLPSVQDGVTKINDEPNLEVTEKESVNVECDAKEDTVEAFPVESESADVDKLSILPGNVVTEEMIKEEKQLEEEGLQKEKKLAEDQDKLWKQMSEQDRDQRYQRLKFLLSKSNMYTQYLIDRMKRQTEEEQKKREKQIKRLKKRDEKLKEQKAKEQEQETAGSSSQSSEVSVSDTSSKRSRKRKSSVSSSDLAKATKTPGKRTKKGGTNEASPDSQNEDKENSQGDANTTEQSQTDEVSKEKFDEKVTETESTETTNLNGAQETQTEEEPNPLTLPKRIIKGEEAPEGQPSMFSGGVLRKYQMEGTNWLKVLFENGVNGILADEMGLGKTVQCIALIAHLVEMKVAGPFLVVGPLSTVPNWYNEFRRFTPKVPVVLYHGSKDERRTLRYKMRNKHPVKKNIDIFPVVITSYEIAMNDRAYMQNFDWKYLIVDEGHRLKNTHCRLIRELRMYHTTHRLLLTGTPLQNNLSELWSLLNFLLPEIFDDLGSFEAWFDVSRIQDDAADETIVAEEQKDNIISMLHQILTPFMLRRLKSDVELVIPPKREVMVMAPLTQMQKDYYSAIVDKTILVKLQVKYEEPETVELNSKGRPTRKSTKTKVDYRLMVEDPKDDEPKKNKKAEYEEDLESWVQTIINTQEERSKKAVKVEKPELAMISVKMQNSMMQLRKCCSHPYLLEHPIDQDTGLLIADETIVKLSGKMLMLDRLLPELKQRGHKVLIFSQMTRMLNILESYCEIRKYQYCRLDGSRSVGDRGEQIKNFNEDPNIFLFLVSTRAGGLGINLTAADTVIIYDSDWNPQSDLQAQDRCHRIGQTRPVLVYRFVTANTIDQRIVERAAAKRKLEKLIIHKGKFKTGMKEFSTSLKPISAEELLELLRSRDHEGVIQGSEKNVISNKDLESLLDRSDLYRKMEALKETLAEGKKQKKSKAKSKSKEPVMEGKAFKVIDEDDGCYTNKMKDSQELSQSLETDSQER